MRKFNGFASRVISAAVSNRTQYYPKAGAALTASGFFLYSASEDSVTEAESSDLHTAGASCVAGLALGAVIGYWYGTSPNGPTCGRTLELEQQAKKAKQKVQERIPWL